MPSLLLSDEIRHQLAFISSWTLKIKVRNKPRVITPKSDKLRDSSVWYAAALPYGPGSRPVAQPQATLCASTYTAMRPHTAVLTLRYAHTGSTHHRHTPHPSHTHHVQMLCSFCSFIISHTHIFSSLHFTCIFTPPSRHLFRFPFSHLHTAHAHCTATPPPPPHHHHLHTCVDVVGGWNLGGLHWMGIDQVHWEGVTGPVPDCWKRMVEDYKEN